MFNSIKTRWCNHYATLVCCLLITTLFITSIVLAPTARAHFNLNVNLRVIHASHEDNGLRVFIRLPMAYLVADKLGLEQADGSREAAPFTTNAIENEQLVHYLDPTALRLDPEGLGKIIVDGHEISVNGQMFIGSLVKLRAYPALQQVPFATLKEAELALKGEVYQEGFEATYVGDTIVDAEIFYASPTNNKVSNYTLRSTLNPGLPLQDETANLVLDYLGSDTLTFRLRGLLDTPVEISRSSLQAFATFVVEGARHILIGIDHVLFVFCLVLSAVTLRGLLWRITGFTIGHSITLSAGFFGYTLSGAWFVPFVETAIAISIIYAAVIALSKERREGGVWVTTLIGLLHGLGFSFVLSEILKIDAPNIWQSLLAFNVGVELGQVAIILVSWLLLLFLSKRFPARISAIRWTMAIVCIAVASIWTGERTLQLVSTLIS